MYIDFNLSPSKAFYGKIEEVIKKPKIITVNKFDENSAKEFAKDFSEALSTGQSIVPILIDSYGGNVYSLLSMIDVLTKSPIPVATIVLGKAMSCGAVLLSAGNNGLRYASPNSTILIHEVSSSSFGKNEEIQSDAEHTKKLNKKLFEIMSLNCDKDKDYFEKIYRNDKSRADWFLDSKEAKKHNLINNIGIPKINISVNIQMELH